MIPQVHAMQKFVYGFFALSAIGHSFEQSDLVQHLFGIYPRIDSEILREIAQLPAHLFLCAEHIEIVEMN